MALDFDKLKSASSSRTAVDPRKLFAALPRKSSTYGYLRDVQAEVLEGWFARRSERDLVLKMNTGGGKTIVGLLILQSSLNEQQGPVVYVAPDKYLAEQVLRQAEALGLAAVNEPRDAAFAQSKAILVTNLYALFNGRSVFGVGDEGIKLPIGTLLVDDAHSCLSITEEQFTLKLSIDHPAYAKLFALFEGDLRRQSEAGFLSVKEQDPAKVMLVPFWAWQAKQAQVVAALHEHRRDDELKFQWPLLQESLSFCQCVFGGGDLEISIRCLPVDVVRSFGGAKRRIYMTATLADDGILITNAHANPASVQRAVTPKSAGDLGDRMILAPQQLNPSISDDELKGLLRELAAKYNVVVIVPSRARADRWADIADTILTADNLQDGVQRLKAGHVGLVVMVNKYDGVDLPGAACRVLVIDGLPEVSRMIERVDASMLEGSRRVLTRHVQRIEQGMGRGIRSNDDHCLVLLMGSRLIQRLGRTDAQAMLTEGTRAQVALSNKVAEQLDGKPLAALRDVMHLCLKQDQSWLEASRGALAAAEYTHRNGEHPVAHAQRAAFEAARVQQHAKAVAAMQDAVGAATDDVEAGWLKQQLAEYVNRTDSVEAQKLMLSALASNRFVLKPIDGVSYSRVNPPAKSQADTAIQFVKQRYASSNACLLGMNAILDDLRFSPGTFKRFEKALNDLAFHLGFCGQRPDAEYGAGPDNLWALGELRFLVIECKNEATAELISKEYANQLSGSMNWFRASYDDTCTPTPIIVHPSRRFSPGATPWEGTRVVTAEQLDAFKEAIGVYCRALAAPDGLNDSSKTARLLEQLGLTASKLVPTFTIGWLPER